jgi:hypothetical protein
VSATVASSCSSRSSTVSSTSSSAEAEEHLARCGYCRRRYVFEEKLRVYVRLAVEDDVMSAELKAKLASLRIAL